MNDVVKLWDKELRLKPNDALVDVLRQAIDLTDEGYEVVVGFDACGAFVRGEFLLPRETVSD